MLLFLVAVILLFVSSLAGAATMGGSRFWARISLTTVLAGSLLGLVATTLALLDPESARLTLPWQVPGGALSLRIDGLSAIFLLPAFLITGTSALYGAGYWPLRPTDATGTWWRTFYGATAGGIVLLLAADNAVLFLFAWEIMALCCFFLVATERGNEEAQSASFLYLIATHTGTLALFGLFATLALEYGNSARFPAVGSLDGGTPAATIIFLLGLVGFGVKAGVLPLHIWLPKAHAAAPSHVSALMSGVVIKTGIYGFLRITSLFHSIPAWWGWTMLFLGLTSGVLGVVLALAQHDIKRLLAYHSVENIGIILIGFGVALLGHSHQAPVVMTLGLAGALLHVVNHGLFKALLFYAAGAVIHATGTRQMARYGGLLRTMPYTGLFFLGGAVAICGLPPLNGFVSEWLVYLGLLQTMQNDVSRLAVAVLAAPGLALIGGLALLCFAKVFGLCFLGTPRSKELTPHEAPASMLAAMAVLLFWCLWIGLAPATVLPLVAAGVKAWTGGEDGLTLTAVLSPATVISLCAALLLLVAGSLAFFSNRRKAQPITAAPTWGCGYPFAIDRVQYSTSSFAQIMVDLFHWALRTVTHRKETGGLFRSVATFATHTPDAALDIVAQPGFRSLAICATKVRGVIQHGMIHIYILYAVLTLCGLLLLAMTA